MVYRHRSGAGDSRYRFFDVGIDCRWQYNFKRPGRKGWGFSCLLLCSAPSRLANMQLDLSTQVYWQKAIIAFLHPGSRPCSNRATGHDLPLAKQELPASERPLLIEAAIHGLLLDDSRSAIAAVGSAAH